MLVCFSTCNFCLVILVKQVVENFLYKVTKVYGFYFKPILPMYSLTPPHVFNLKLRYIAF